MFWTHVLVLVILLGVPLLATYDHRKLRANSEPKHKITMYYKLMLLLWTLTLLAIIASDSLHHLFVLPQRYTGSIMFTLLAVVIMLYFFVTSLLPLFMLNNRDFRNNVKTQFDKKIFMYPRTRKEQQIFVGVAITVGICEEVLYRSFLWNYLQNSIGMTYWVSFVVVAVLFGLGHFLQGISGIINSIIVGLFLGFLFIYSGSLWLPIIIHILLDLKIVMVSYVLSGFNRRPT